MFFHWLKAFTFNGGQQDWEEWCFLFCFGKCAPFPAAPHYHYHIHALPTDLPVLWEETVGNDMEKRKRWVGVTWPPFREQSHFSLYWGPFSKHRSNTGFKLVWALCARSTLQCFALLNYLSKNTDLTKAARGKNLGDKVSIWVHKWVLPRITPFQNAGHQYINPRTKLMHLASSVSS